MRSKPRPRLAPSIEVSTTAAAAASKVSAARQCPEALPAAALNGSLIPTPAATRLLGALLLQIARREIEAGGERRDQP